MKAGIKALKRKVYNYYRESGRKELPWRKEPTPYRVYISEIMLQQTQVDRVIPLFNRFVAALPDFSALAKVDQPDLLSLWQGLGYNRRALFLKRAAEIICSEYGGELPQIREQLQSLPGIGEATSGSIMVYAFNAPEVYIETNIRTVYIHEFFADKKDIPDSDLLPLIEASLVDEEPFQWYSALMDYGTMLKKQIPNPSRKSKHHIKQSKFEGSDRQIRGAILRALLDESSMSLDLVSSKVDADSKRLKPIIAKLVDEGFCLREESGNYSLVK